MTTRKRLGHSDTFVDSNRAHRKKIGLALGGGGARGLAHIGIIKALTKADIPIDYIAGTSMGALVGGYYATVGDVYSLESLFLKLRRRDIFPVTRFFGKHDGTLFKHSEIAKILEGSFDIKTFKDCAIPFRAVATDVRNGDEVVLADGKLADAIHASIALPLIFEPVEIGKRLLMDGGFSNPVPADVVRAMGADFVIAVDVSSQWLNISDELADLRNIYNLVSNALSVVEYQLSRRVLAGADLVLHPPVMNRGRLEFDRAAELVNIGEEEINIHLKEVRAAVGIAAPLKTLTDTFFDFLVGR